MSYFPVCSRREFRPLSPTDVVTVTTTDLGARHHLATDAAARPDGRLLLLCSDSLSFIGGTVFYNFVGVSVMSDVSLSPCRRSRSPKRRRFVVSSPQQSLRRERLLFLTSVSRLFSPTPRRERHRSKSPRRHRSRSRDRRHRSKSPGNDSETCRRDQQTSCNAALSLQVTTGATDTAATQRPPTGELAPRR